MHLRQIIRLLPIASLLTFGLVNANAQTQDNSKNALLQGSYVFRHVVVQNVDQTTYDPTEITAIYGTITFDGAGNYAIAGTMVDNTVSGGSPTPLSATGTYAIGSNGAGYLTNYLPNEFDSDDPNSYIYGAVAQGVYTGSVTEAGVDGAIFNDIFVAIPVSSSAPTNASFTSAYQTGLLDFDFSGSGDATNVNNALFELSPNGKGGFSAIALSGQTLLAQGNLAQTVTGATYSFNKDGSATLTIPLPSGVTAANSANAMFTGTKTMFESADGNFILGWTATGYDIFFGVKALTATATNSLSTGLYFTTALEDYNAAFDGTGTDSYYGGTNGTGDSVGDTIVHQRLNVPDAPSFDYGAGDNITLAANGSATDTEGYNYNFGDGGQAFVAIGTYGYFSLVVGMHAPAFSGSGVYLNPIGVANAASLQPVTASIAPGELIVLYGSGLSSTSATTPGNQAFPTNLAGVSVTIDGIPCPIYYVTPGQLAVTVPYEVALNQTGLANIQVTNNNVQSNVVQVYLTDAAPGLFSQGADGIGYAAALHAATGQLITQANPAQRGETISLYLTGLGTVTPTIEDGAVGPSSPLSWSDLYNAGALGVGFYDPNSGEAVAGTISYAGLVPTLSGLYQINVTLPKRGLLSGDDVYVQIFTDAAETMQVQIPYGAGAPNPDVAGAAALSDAAKKAARVAAARSRAVRPATRRMVRGGSAADSGH